MLVNILGKDISYAKNQSGSNSTIIYDNGLKVKGIFYSEDEFSEALKHAVKIKNQNHQMKDIREKGEGMQPTFAFVIPAWAIGTWVLPLIGVVVISSFEIIVNDIKQEVGSWLFNKVIEWINNKSDSEKRDYKKLSDWELRKFGIDPHSFKKQYVGNQGSRFNIYVDRNTGEIILIGNGQIIETGVYINK